MDIVIEDFAVKFDAAIIIEENVVGRSQAISRLEFKPSRSSEGYVFGIPTLTKKPTSPPATTDPTDNLSEQLHVGRHGKVHRQTAAVIRAEI